jgi:RNA polymerase sigma-70 factor (ECF subfamily)
VADDQDIIASSLGDPQAFEEIFDRHWTAVLRYAQQRVGHDAGEEVAARTFLIAFEQRQRFGSGHPSAKPWLFGITTNLIHRHRRQERIHFAALRRLPNSPAEVPDDVAGKLDAQAQSAVLAGALDKLDPQNRDAFLLMALAELTYPEISVALGIPEGTVASKVNRARAKLREVIGPEKAIDDVMGE